MSTTLAYVFWHTAAAGVDRARYEDALVAFHRALAENPPSGFLRSHTLRLDAVPWLGGRPGYEDRYLVEDSAALDPLNEAAVAAGMRVPHDAVARLADDGAGGLYREERPGSGMDGGADGRSVAIWLSKPRDVAYPAFRAALEDAAPPTCALWQRQMVLGPAPEFCLTGDDEGELTAGLFPDAWRPVTVGRERLSGG